MSQINLTFFFHLQSFKIITLPLFGSALSCEKTYVRFLFTASSSHSHLLWKTLPLVFSVPWLWDKRTDETSELASVGQTGGVDANCCRKKRCVLARGCRAGNQSFIVP